MNKPRIIIFGGGQIGTACNAFIYDLFYNEEGPNGVEISEVWEKFHSIPELRVDVDLLSVEELTDKLIADKTTHVIVAMPFMYNEKIAQAAAVAGCHYIDFTEDDIMADKVQAIYKNYPELTCAVKCGLAPGFINYIGHDLVKRFDKCEHLMISVGALPRNVNWNIADPEKSYNLSWSVDGLVNEYIRPCRVRMHGQEMEIPPLSGQEIVFADGVEYEAAYTSGGVGSLVKELTNVPFVAYKTLRYPGHYDYVRKCVARHQGNFEGIKAEFLKAFPFNRNDVIVVYAEAKGTKDGKYTRETFSDHYIGVEFFSGIQSTTAGAGIAMLEMMLAGTVKGIVNHADVSFQKFLNTQTFKATYRSRNVHSLF